MAGRTFEKVAVTLLLIFQVVFAPDAWAQTDADEGSVSLDLSFQQYILPSEADLSIPAFALSWDEWLLIGRYNYERRNTASVWVGRTFSWEPGAWELEITPIAGGLMGATHGVAPGLLFDLSVWRLNLYSELEYVFDLDDREENFFYSWSQLSFSVFDAFRIGVVGNRTRAYDSPVELDRGLIVEADIEPFTVSCTVLNLDEDPLVILGASASFENLF